MDPLLACNRHVVTRSNGGHHVKLHKHGGLLVDEKGNTHLPQGDQKRQRDDLRGNGAQISTHSPLVMMKSQQPGTAMACWGWMLLWLVAGESAVGPHSTDCATKNFLWTYSPGSKEEFVLFCDFSHVHQRSPHSPVPSPSSPSCNASVDLSDVRWYRQPRIGGPLEEITEDHPGTLLGKSSLHFLTPAVNFSGGPQDACCVRTILEVKPQTTTSCTASAPHKQFLLLGSVGSIYCPLLSCQNESQRTDVTWYQDGRLRPREKGRAIFVDEVYSDHQGMYVCDYTRPHNASAWTVRAVVHVRTIVSDTKFKPDILHPVNDVMEVEVGEPFSLLCTVRFGFEKDFSPVIRWYIRDSEREWEAPMSQERSVKLTLKDEVIERTASLKEVTERDLSRKFICFAQNSIGNATQTLRLKAKRGVAFLYVLLSTVSALVGMLVAGALLYIYWIEIVLLYRTYQSKDETSGDKKEFDAFVSYAKCSSADGEAPSPLGEEYLALTLFPEVLENKYGYTLCLLERDVAPGGVYAEDIVDMIKKSRRGIFILSPNYMNGPCIFELQAAVNLALGDQTLKLILIKFCSFQEPKPLPHLVRKALRVLPMVPWKGLKSLHSNSRFWTQMRYYLPVKSSRRFS
ncbi:interleukin-18 receptor accessory protein [Ctenodactylus gundi]